MIGGYSLLQFLVLIIVVAAACAIVFVVLRAMGVAIPPWIVQIGWILLACALGIVALKFLAGLAGAV